VVGGAAFLRTCANTGDPQPFGAYEIRRREDGYAIGGLGFHGAPNENGSVTIGYDLIPSAQSRGYASEALRALLAFARAYGISCVEGDTDHDNTASQHVMIAVGMRLVAEDERLKHYKIAWSDAAAITDPRSSSAYSASGRACGVVSIANISGSPALAGADRPISRCRKRLLLIWPWARAS
jgi:GNAT superfamily N-acetyltransferase